MLYSSEIGDLSQKILYSSPGGANREYKIDNKDIWLSYQETMYNYVKVGDNVTTFMQNNFLQYVNSYILDNTVQLDSDFDSNYDTTNYLVIYFFWAVKNWV